jgi:hypothetical protein
MPYEYIHMFILALVPPMWHMLVDPMVISIEDAVAGRVNKDAWNNDMPLSEDDKFRRKICNVFFGVTALAMTGVVFIV